MRVLFQDYRVIPISAFLFPVYSDYPLPLTLTSTVFTLLNRPFRFLSDYLSSQVLFLSPHAPGLPSLTYTVDHLLTVAPHFLLILPHSSWSLLLSLPLLFATVSILGSTCPLWASHSAPLSFID